MTTHTLVHWKPNSPTNLPELQALWNDLFQARWYAKQLQDCFAQGGERFALIEPLAIAALTKYFRVFGSGRRARLRPSQDSEFPRNLAENHKWLQAIRDKHFQHPVNKFEVDYVTLSVAELGTPEARATSVSAGSHSIWGLSSEQAGVLIELCDYWMRKISEDQKLESERLMRDAETLTVAELNELEMASEQPSEDPFDLR